MCEHFMLPRITLLVEVLGYSPPEGRLLLELKLPHSRFFVVNSTNHSGRSCTESHRLIRIKKTAPSFLEPISIFFLLVSA